MSMFVAVRRFPGLRAIVALAALAAVVIVAREARGPRRSGAPLAAATPVPVPDPAVAAPSPAPAPTLPPDRGCTMPPAPAPIRAIVIGDRIREVLPGHYEIDASLVDDVLRQPTSLAGSVRMIPHFTDGAPSGVRIYAVRPGGLAARLGLRNGDTLLTIDGLTVTWPDHALAVYADLRAHTSRTHTLTLRRRGESLTFHYTIVHRPPPGTVTLAL